MVRILDTVPTYEGTVEYYNDNRFEVRAVLDVGGYVEHVFDKTDGMVYGVYRRDAMGYAHHVADYPTFVAAMDRVRRLS